MSQMLLYGTADTSGVFSAGESFQMLLMPLLGVIFVIFLAYGFTRWISKKMNGMTGGRCVKVVERIPVGKDKELLVIEVNGQAYLLGVTGQNITTICFFDASDLPKPAPPEPGFKSVLEKTLKGNRIFPASFGEEGGDGEAKNR